MSTPSFDGRPKITYEHGSFRHNGKRCRVVLRQSLVSIACSDITPEALRRLLDEWNKRFYIEPEFIVQAGGEDENAKEPDELTAERRRQQLSMERP